MPPFKYEAFVNPYIGSISELMGKGDEAKAQALLRIGEIQARAAEQRGQAWGNAIQGLGNIASKAITDYNDPKLKMEKMALAQAEEDERNNVLLGNRMKLRQPSTSTRVVDGTPVIASVDPRDMVSRQTSAQTPELSSRVPSTSFGKPFDVSNGGMAQVGTTSPSLVSTTTSKGLYEDENGLFNYGKAYQDLINGGASPASATRVLESGQKTNTALSAYAAQTKAFATARTDMFGNAANTILKALEASPTLTVQAGIQQMLPMLRRQLPEAEYASLQQQVLGMSEAEARQALTGLVDAMDAQHETKVLGRDQILATQSGRIFAEGLRTPPTDPSAASKTLARAEADYAEGIRNGSIPPGTTFTEWFKKTTPAVPTSIQEYNFAVSQGYKGTYDEYQTMVANRRRPLTVNNAPTDDAMIAEAARNIVANPRDMTSPKTISSLRGDQRMRLFNEIKRISPDFNVGNIERQIKFLDTYENPAGRAAINRSSMNNILMHAADLSVVNETYRRSNLRLVNTAISEIAKQGGTTWSQFMTPLQVLKDEIALYFAGGYAPKGQQQAAWEQIVNDKATPSQVEQFAKDIIHVGLRRADTANEQFKTMMGYDDPNLITPEAVRAAQRLGLRDEVKKYGSGGQIGARGETKEQRATRMYNSLTGGN